MTGHSEAVMSAADSQGAQGLQELISQHDPGLKWAAAHCFTPDQGEALACTTQKCKATAVSDGSSKEGFGAAGLILEGDEAISRALARSHHHAGRSICTAVMPQ